MSKAKTLHTLPTPCLVLDRAKLRRNIARMTVACARNGVTLRPHLKTAKSIPVANLLTGPNVSGIAVSTLLEAEYFAQNGFQDIQYAVGITPDKLDRAARIQQIGARVTLVTDNLGTAREICRYTDETGTVFHVLIEIDCGERRSGLDPSAPELLDLARTLADANNVVLDGVMTHAGHSYTCRSLAEIEAVAEAERLAVVTAAERIRAAGMACPTVSVGSSPTALHARHLTGVTETRAGVFMFGDVFQAQILTCTLDDLAVSVLTEVTGHRADLGHMTIDAGGLAMSKDRSTENVENDVGFGLMADLSGEVFAPQLTIARVYQEHGLVPVTEPHRLEDFPIGRRLRVYPNHVCMTASMYPGYFVVDSEESDGVEVVEEWSRISGW
ncbi:alanine racemase [Tropicimonas sp. IMCC6043]|uniref:alanine racemase n=1 Tax=Tropicimonas sp. IMCC6043 TaxID=2510645 RepID=UPI0013ECCD25|nr:alanine racemase [Tropicimonas sp. IMCC6043]